MPAFLVCVIYRAPRLNFPSDFWASLGRELPFYSQVIVMGDLNINLLNSSTLESRRLVQEAESLDLTIVPFTPTHHTLTSHTWIDHVLVSKHSNIIDSSQYPSSVSGHDLILVKLSFPDTKTIPRTFEFRDFAKIDMASFLRDLNQCDWDAFTESNSVDFKVKFFNRVIFDTLNSHAPVNRVLGKKPAAPWITDHIRGVMRQRDRSRDRHRRSDNPELRPEFVRLRNLVTRLISASRSAYFIKLFKSSSQKDLEKRALTWNR